MRRSERSPWSDLGVHDDRNAHIDNILTYYQYPVSNAMSEGLNSKIQKIKRMACGFHNLENFKTAIYFHCGGLDLTHTEPGSAIFCNEADASWTTLDADVLGEKNDLCF